MGLWRFQGYKRYLGWELRIVQAMDARIRAELLDLSFRQARADD